MSKRKIHQRVRRSCSSLSPVVSPRNIDRLSFVSLQNSINSQEKVSDELECMALNNKGGLQLGEIPLSTVSVLKPLCYDAVFTAGEQYTKLLIMMIMEWRIRQDISTSKHMEILKSARHAVPDRLVCDFNNKVILLRFMDTYRPKHKYALKCVKGFRYLGTL